MKLKYNFAISEVAGQTVAVPLDCPQKEQGIIKTNQTGAYILRLLKDDVSVSDIINKIKQDFEIDSEENLTNWVNGFIDKLKTAEVLIYE